MMIVSHRHFMRLIVMTKMSLELTKHYLANEIKSGFKRVHVAYVDPVA